MHIKFSFMSPYDHVICSYAYPSSSTFHMYYAYLFLNFLVMQGPMLLLLLLVDSD